MSMASLDRLTTNLLLRKDDERKQANGFVDKLRIATCGDLTAVSLPKMKTRPEVIGSAPNTARTSSVRPAPTRPAMPRISPA